MRRSRLGRKQRELIRGGSRAKAIYGPLRSVGREHQQISCLVKRQIDRIERIVALDRESLQPRPAEDALLVVIDEPLRGLDAFAQSVMRDLLRNLRAQEGPAFLVVTADFAVARGLCEEAMVLEDGRVIERGQLADLVRAPKEPQTKALIEATLLPSI